MILTQQIILLYPVAYNHIKAVKQCLIVLTSFWQNILSFFGDTSHMENVYSSLLGSLNASPLERNGGICFGRIIGIILTSQHYNAQLRSKLEPLMMSIVFIFFFSG